jgi:hypothetical protein
MDGKAFPVWPGPANRQVGLSAGHPAGRGSALVWPREARDPVFGARLAQGTAGPWQLRTPLELAALPGAVPCSRLHARQVLWEWGLSAITETAELLVSEFVTNSVKAAQATDYGPLVQVRLSVNRVHLLVEVWDGNTQPVIHEAHRFVFPTLADIAEYLSTSPKYGLPPGLAEHPAALATALRHRTADGPVTATSVVTYLWGIRAPTEAAP